MVYGLRITRGAGLDAAVSAEVLAVVRRDLANGRRTNWAWASVESANDDPWAGAVPTLEHGEVVDVDGDSYRVTVLGPEFVEPLVLHKAE